MLERQDEKNTDSSQRFFTDRLSDNIRKPFFEESAVSQQSSEMNQVKRIGGKENERVCGNLQKACRKARLHIC